MVVSSKKEIIITNIFLGNFDLYLGLRIFLVMIKIIYNHHVTQNTHNQIHFNQTGRGIYEYSILILTNIAKNRILRPLLSVPIQRTGNLMSIPLPPHLPHPTPLLFNMKFIDFLFPFFFFLFSLLLFWFLYPKCIALSHFHTRFFYYFLKIIIS